MNQCTFVGNLGRDPELREVGSGKKVLKFSIAVRPNYVPKGVEKPAPNWVNVVVWGKTAEALAGLRKGQRVFVTGEYQVSSYQGKDGTKKYNHEISGSICYPLAARDFSGGAGSSAGGYDPEMPGGMTEDDIPF
jgi:single-strand DNA-binding protein